MKTLLFYDKNNVFITRTYLDYKSSEIKNSINQILKNYSAYHKIDPFLTYDLIKIIDEVTNKEINLDSPEDDLSENNNQENNENNISDANNWKNPPCSSCKIKEGILFIDYFGSNFCSEECRVAFNCNNESNQGITSLESEDITNDESFDSKLTVNFFRELDFNELRTSNPTIMEIFNDVWAKYPDLHLYGSNSTQEPIEWYRLPDTATLVTTTNAYGHNPNCIIFYHPSFWTQVKNEVKKVLHDTFSRVRLTNKPVTSIHTTNPNPVTSSPIEQTQPVRHTRQNPILAKMKLSSQSNISMTVIDQDQDQQTRTETETKPSSVEIKSASKTNEEAEIELLQLKKKITALETEKQRSDYRINIMAHNLEQQELEMKTLINSLSEHMIQERAYYIWKETGNNDAVSNYYQAKKELRTKDWSLLDDNIENARTEKPGKVGTLGKAETPDKNKNKTLQGKNKIVLETININKNKIMQTYDICIICQKNPPPVSACAICNRCYGLMLSGKKFVSSSNNK